MTRPNWIPVSIAAAGLAYVAVQASHHGGMRLALATGIGALGGFALYHAAFGFTAGWRRLVAESKGAGVRHQLLLVGLVILASYPLIGWNGAGAFVVPVGLGLLVGAFLFGMGMQWGGGCGSGTLFTVGGGSTRMVITLSFFIIGSMFGRAHAPWWGDLPGIGRVSLVRDWGVMPALLITLILLAGLALATVAWEKRRTGAVEWAPRKTESWMSGPWSMLIGVIALAIVCIATFLVLNRPWGITSAFAIWGGKLAAGIGVPIAETPYWRISERALERSVFASSVSVMNFGLMLGALMAAGLAAKFRPVFTLSRTEIATAVAGGLLMGFGARLSGGCNIGAFLGGVASGSLHGWVWLVAAFGGSSLVVWLRSTPNLPMLRRATA